MSQPLWNGAIFIICTVLINHVQLKTPKTHSSLKTQALTNNYFIGWILIVLEFVIQSQCFDVDNGYKLPRNHLINWEIGSEVFKCFSCVFSKFKMQCKTTSWINLHKFCSQNICQLIEISTEDFKHKPEEDIFMLSQYKFHYKYC